MTYVSPDDLPFYITYHYEENNSEKEEAIKRKFETVLSSLNPRQKEAFYLRYQLELSYEEIAQLLGINYQSARNLIHRSMLKIRKNMHYSAFMLLFTDTVL
ncbi:MAG: sigma-70 region 4 domain-containing protein [Bacteroides sp.]|nr:sigma-70 region 4 domain-containing protein [Bacteroides sp.]